MSRGSNEKRGGKKKAASGPPLPRTPAPGLWRVPLLVALVWFVKAGPEEMLAWMRASGARILGPAGPLAPDARYPMLLCLIGVVALLLGGWLRARSARYYLPYALFVVVICSVLANLLLFADVNRAQPEWQFARKRTGSLTEAALMSPSRFREGRGRLCLMVRDHLRDRQLVTAEKDFFRIGLAYREAILPEISVKTVEHDMTVGVECAEKLLSLPSEELLLPDGSMYRFIRSRPEAQERVLHLCYREFNFLVPESLARKIAREGVAVDALEGLGRDA